MGERVVPPGYHPVADADVIKLLLAVGNDEMSHLPFEQWGWSTLSDVERAHMVRMMHTAVFDKAELLLDMLPKPLGRGRSNLLTDVLAQVQATLEAGFLGPRGLELNRRNYFPNLSITIYYGILLLLDKGTEYSRKFRRCKFNGCMKFYIAEKNPSGGGLNMTYCTPAHREAAHNSKQNRSPRKSK